MEVKVDIRSKMESEFHWNGNLACIWKRKPTYTTWMVTSD